jgi:hypothetical protein
VSSRQTELSATYGVGHSTLTTAFVISVKKCASLMMDGLDEEDFDAALELGKALTDEVDFEPAVNGDYGVAEDSSQEQAGVVVTTHEFVIPVIDSEDDDDFEAPRPRAPPRNACNLVQSPSPCVIGNSPRSDSAEWEHSGDSDAPGSIGGRDDGSGMSDGAIRVDCPVQEPVVAPEPDGLEQLLESLQKLSSTQQLVCREHASHESSPWPRITLVDWLPSVAVADSKLPSPPRPPAKEVMSGKALAEAPVPQTVLASSSAPSPPNPGITYDMMNQCAPSSAVAFDTTPGSLPAATFSPSAKFSATPNSGDLPVSRSRKLRKLKFSMSNPDVPEGSGGTQAKEAEPGVDGFSDVDNNGDDEGDSVLQSSEDERLRNDSLDYTRLVKPRGSSLRRYFDLDAEVSGSDSGDDDDVCSFRRGYSSDSEIVSIYLFAWFGLPPAGQ